MKVVGIWITCMYLSGCVSADCRKDCYILEFRKQVEGLEYKCQMGSIDPECEPPKSAVQIGY